MRIKCFPLTCVPSTISWNWYHFDMLRDFMFADHACQAFKHQCAPKYIGKCKNVCIGIPTQHEQVRSWFTRN